MNAHIQVRTSDDPGISGIDLLHAQQVWVKVKVKGKGEGKDEGEGEGEGVNFLVVRPQGMIQSYWSREIS